MASPCLFYPEEQLKLDAVAEATNGLEAVWKAQELQPDLILLDIGLPKLNGIDVSRRIRELSRRSKILFLSDNRSWDIAEEALSTGALGYVVKSDAANDLLPGVEAVLQGKQFVSASLACLAFSEGEHGHCRPHADLSNVVELIPRQKIPSNHEVGFYIDDRALVNDVTQFITNALKAGNAAVVVATELHRDSLFLRLQSQGLDIDAAVARGRYIALDASGALSMFMLNGLPDPTRFMKAFGELILRTANSASGNSRRVAVFGECVHLLWARGNVEAAIQMEKLGNYLAHSYDVDILCGYSLGAVHGGIDTSVLERVCAEHSAVRSQ